MTSLTPERRAEYLELCDKAPDSLTIRFGENGQNGPPVLLQNAEALYNAVRTAFPEYEAALSEAEGEIEKLDWHRQQSNKYEESQRQELARVKDFLAEVRGLYSRQKDEIATEKARADRLQAELDAERERCAKIADTEAAESKGDKDYSGFGSSKRIAAAIRKGERA